VAPNPSPAAAGPLAAARESAALNPIALAWTVQMGVSLLAGFGLHLTAGQAGAVSSIAAALVGVITALAARPWFIPAITGGVTAILTACAAFGLHWSGEQVSAAATALGVILMLVAHGASIPLAAARQGLTADELLLAQTVRPGSAKR
jgi:hypothetical protein